jgi:hypothetical protein
MQLAAGVGQADVVGVDQGQGPDRRPRQRLDQPRADAPEPDDRDMAPGQARGRAAAVEPVDAGEALLEVGGHRHIVVTPTASTGAGAGAC